MQGPGDGRHGNHFPLDTTASTWADWDALARWLEAVLIEEDWRARLVQVPGQVFASEADLAGLPWRDNAVVKKHAARSRLLHALMVGDPVTDRGVFVQGYVRRLGVSLSRTNAYHEGLSRRRAGLPPHLPASREPSRRHRQRAAGRDSKTLGPAPGERAHADRPVSATR
jgi:hypothetical protein